LQNQLKLNRGERLQIMLMPGELRVIDTWRFAKRMPSRASAIRELLKRGLAADGFGEVLDGQKSKDFSVLSDKLLGGVSLCRSSLENEGLPKSTYYSVGEPCQFKVLGSYCFRGPLVAVFRRF